MLTHAHTHLFLVRRCAQHTTLYELAVHRQFAGVLGTGFRLTLSFNQKGVIHNLRLEFSSLFTPSQKCNCGNRNEVERNNIFHLISLLEAKQ